MADNRRKPGAHVFDSIGARGGGAEPRVLHGIFGIVERSEHAIGHPAQIGAVLFELKNEGIVWAIGHIPPRWRVTTMNHPNGNVTALPV